GRRIPPAALYNAATVEQLAHTILQQSASSDEAAITEIQPGVPESRFFLLHGDFNGGGFYSVPPGKELRARLGVEFVPPPELNDKSAPMSIEEMAEAHLAALKAFQPSGPYRLGGYCIGGLVAFEMARRLHEDGQPIGAPLLLDSTFGSASHASDQTWE